MASRASSAHWVWRDLRLSFVVLVFGAMSVGAVLYLSGSISSPRQWTDSPPERVLQADNEVLYTGSVIVVPTEGEQCSQYLFDNRTGRMRDNGYIDCYSVVSQLVEEAEKNSVTPSKRMNVISNAFRGK
jgi:hypothetical protein